MKTLLSKNYIIAILLLALSVLLVIPAAQAQTGSGDNYSWQFECGDWNLVSSVVFISAQSGQNRATDFVIENCAVLVTMYTGNYIDGWDEESLSLAPVLSVAETLDVPIFFMRVDHGAFEPGGFGPN